MLTQRQRQILGIVVSSFVHSALPVSSHSIAEEHALGVSSATIRNELGTLEEMGYIMHPHTSAGRLPTDQGYRYYVDHLLAREEISREIAMQVADIFRERAQNLDELARRASKLLSSLSSEASLILFPKLEVQHFKKVTLIPVNESHLVVVWISTNGWVTHGSLELENPLDAKALGQLADFLNRELTGLAFRDVENFLVSELRKRRDSLAHLYEVAIRVVKESLAHSQELRVFLEGSSHLFGKPEFDDLEKSRKLMEMLESKKDLLKIFDESAQPGGLKVRIGNESLLEDFQDLALITSAYRLKDDSIGVLGVLGSKRMNYSRVISLVEFMADQMAETLHRNF